MNAEPRSITKHVTFQHVLAAVLELYGVEALDKVTGRAIERAGYMLPGSAPIPLPVPAGMTPEEAWRELCKTGDRTSPEEYPDHALITREELAGYILAALQPQEESRHGDPLPG